MIRRLCTYTVVRAAGRWFRWQPGGRSSPALWLPSQPRNQLVNVSAALTVGSRAKGERLQLKASGKREPCYPRLRPPANSKNRPSQRCVWMCALVHWIHTKNGSHACSITWRCPTHPHMYMQGELSYSSWISQDGPANTELPPKKLSKAEVAQLAAERVASQNTATASAWNSVSAQQRAARHWCHRSALSARFLFNSTTLHAAACMFLLPRRARLRNGV